MIEPYLLKLSAVEPLSKDDLAAAHKLCSGVHKVSRRRDIISAGAATEHVHVMIEGWAARYAVRQDGSRRITAFLVPGDFCDLHITTLAKMDHGIVAVTDCRVGHVSASAIDSITRESPILTRAFWRATLIDEAILRKWLVNLGRGDALATVAHLICELHVRLRLVGLVSGDTFSLPLTQEEIGDATGMTSVHVNRMLQQMRGSGLIEFQRGQLFIPDVKKLRDIADFDADYLHLRAADAAA